jgi:hypothetical protein
MSEPSSKGRIWRWIDRARAVNFLWDIGIGVVLSGAAIIAWLSQQIPVWLYPLIIVVLLLGIIRVIALCVDVYPRWKAQQAAPRAELAIQYDESIHCVRQGEKTTHSVAIHNKSSIKAEDVSVKISYLRALEKKRADGQNSDQFTGHVLALVRQPSRTKQGFSINPKDNELVKLVWSDKASDEIRFSGYDVNGQFYEDGFKTRKIRYRLELVATATNADPAFKVFEISLTRGKDITVKPATKPAPL